jgi:hypothetical protein
VLVAVASSGGDRERMKARVIVVLAACHPGLVGTVEDATGRPGPPGVTIAVVGARQTAETSDDSIYELPDAPPGIHEVTATCEDSTLRTTVAIAQHGDTVLDLRVPCVKRGEAIPIGWRTSCPWDETPTFASVAVDELVAQMLTEARQDPSLVADWRDADDRPKILLVDDLPRVRPPIVPPGFELVRRKDLSHFGDAWYVGVKSVDLSGRCARISVEVQPIVKHGLGGCSGELIYSLVGGRWTLVGRFAGGCA